MVQHNVLTKNAERLELLGLDHLTLVNIPDAALRQDWTRTVLQDLEKFDNAGKQLVNAGRPPVPAAELYGKYRKAGRQMSSVSRLFSQTISTAREGPYPTSRWQSLANQTADAMNELSDMIKDISNDIEDKCS